MRFTMCVNKISNADDDNVHDDDADDYEKK